MNTNPTPTAEDREMARNWLDNAEDVRRDYEDDVLDSLATLIASVRAAAEKAGVERERERCAGIVNGHAIGSFPSEYNLTIKTIAAALRQPLPPQGEG